MVLNALATMLICAQLSELGSTLLYGTSTVTTSLAMLVRTNQTVVSTSMKHE
jgi:hypothetical protein